jgi:hypothetical protein
MYGLDVRENVTVEGSSLPCRYNIFYIMVIVSLCKDVQIDMNVCPLSLLAGFALWFETADFPSSSPGWSNRGCGEHHLECFKWIRPEDQSVFYAFKRPKGLRLIALQR